MKPEIPATYMNLLALTTGNDIQNRCRSLEMVVDASVNIMMKIGNDKKFTTVDGECELLFQMCVTKCISILRLMEGIDYESRIGNYKIVSLIDPFSIWPIFRNLLETYCVYNNIMIQHNDVKDRNLLHNLWIVAGLKNRQNNPDPNEIFKEKKDYEKRVILNCIEKIKTSKLYLDADEIQKQIIDKAVKYKQYNIKITNGVFSNLTWQDMIFNAGFKNKIFSNIYMILANSSHPSNVSVFQFRDIFNHEDQHELSMYAIQYLRHIMSFFVGDICKQDLGALTVFNNLPDLYQLLINTLNISGRGKEYEINNHIAEFSKRNPVSFINE